MSPTGREQTAGDERISPDAGEDKPRAPAPRPYLRAVYPLNPGIPHFMDFPEGWQ